MKKVCFLLICTTMFMCGCNTSNDGRVAELEEQVNKLQEENEKLKNEKEEVTEAVTEEVIETTTNLVTTTTPVIAEPVVEEPPVVATPTMGQRNAVGSAKNYIEIMGFSYSGLIEQLEYEGYSSEEAKYGAENCGADWNVECAEAAANYLDIMSFSREELRGQLEYEGYTSSQIEYALSAVGY